MSLSHHPDSLRLQKENAMLLEELATLVTERHELEHVEQPYLLSLFQTRLGPWELRLLRSRCEIARLKRKMELFQACLNRGDQPDEARVDATLEAEFQTWQQQISEAAQKIEAAQFRLSHTLSAEETKELKTLYRSLAKRLHPDLLPISTDEQKILWQRVQAAYERCDLEEFRTLALLAEHSTDASVSVDTENDLQIEHDLLLARIRALLTALEAIRSQPPFCHRSQWEDDTWIEQRRAEIETDINNIQPQIVVLKKHLDSLIQPHFSGTKFGPN